MAAAMATVGSRHAFAGLPASWLNAVDGTWSDAANWSISPAFPNNGVSTYDAFINAIGASYTVTLNSNVTVDSLTVNSASATLNQTGGTLHALNGINLQSGTYLLGSGASIVGGTINTTAGSPLIANGGILDGVTLTGEVDIGLQQPNILYINHDSAINGNALVGNVTNTNNGVIFFGVGAVANQTISGTANILVGANLNNTLYNNNQGTLTLASGVTIHGQRASIVNQFSNGLIVNQGLISSDAGGLIVVDNGRGSFSNIGTLETKNGSTLNLGGSWSNSGTITVSSSTLNLGGNFTTAGIGTINRTGGTINLTGTLDNSTTGPLNFNASSGSWLIQQNASIVGGTINTTAGSPLIANGGMIDGVTLNGEVDVGLQQPNILYINHDSTINGAALVGNPSNTNNGLIFFGVGAVANQTISGTANVLVGLSTNNTLNNNNQGTLTLSPNVTIHGQNASIVNQYSNGLIVNQGLISSDAGGSIVVDNGRGSFSNTGTLETKNGSTLNLGGSWSNSGTITVNSSTLNLGGAFTTAGIGTINRTGGIINLTGTLDNSAIGSLNFNASSGSWLIQQNASIVGGTINTTAGNPVIANGGVLDGVTLNGEADVGQQQPAVLVINHDSTINGDVLVGNPINTNNGVIFFGVGAVTNQTISGTANILVGANTNNTLYNNNQGTLILASSVTIHGQKASIINQYSNGLIVNQGLISSDAGGSIAFGTGRGSVSNTGTLAASNGGILTVNSPTLTNLSGNTLTGGHWYAYAGSTIDLGSANITTNAADVRVEGTLNAINNLAINNGTFTVANGKTFNIATNTFINNGTLNAAAGGTITIPGPTSSLLGGTNNGAINCSPGGTIIFNGSFLHAANSFLNGAGSVIFNGGTQTFNGTITGNIDLSLNGVANFGALSHVTTSRPFVTSGNSFLAAGAQVGFGGLAFVGGSSPAIAIGAGANSATLTLSGDVSIASGVVGTSQISTAGSGANDGVLNLGGSRQFTVNNNNATPDLLISAMLTNGSIIKAGPGTMALTHANSLTGVTLSNGTLQVTDPAALGGMPSFLLFNGGTLDLRSDQTTTTYSNTSVGIAGVSQNFNVGPITNAHGGTFQLTYDAIGGNLNVSGDGTLQIANASMVAGSNGMTIENTATVEFNGPLSGTGSITRGGSSGVTTGTVVFSGTAGNSYSGPTVVTRGALVLNKSAGAIAVPHDLQVLGGTIKSLASDQIADNANVSISGGSLDLQGAHESIGTATILAGGLLNSVSELAISTINNNGGATINLAGNAIVENNSGGATFNNAGTTRKDDPGNVQFRDTAGGTLTFVNSGTFVANNGSALISCSSLFNSGTIIANGTVIAMTSQLFVNAGTIQATHGGMLRFNNFLSTFADPQRINLTSGAAIFDYSTSNPFGFELNQVKIGFANGAWTGNGITSSAAAAASGGLHPTAVGIAEASALGITSSGMFMGQTVDSTTVLLRYTYSGDADLDGTVNSSDFDRLAAHFGAAGKAWSDGDYNYDGLVNTLDFNALATNYGQIMTLSADLPDANLAMVDGSAQFGSLVPEPSAVFGVFATFFLGTVRQRRIASGSLSRYSGRGLG